MGVTEILFLSPFAFSLGWLIEPPFDRYILPVLKALGKEL